MRKYQALGENVCDELQSFRRLLVQYDIAGRVDLLVDVGPNHQSNLILFRHREDSGDKRF